MKRIDDYEPSELLALSEETIEQIIDLESAYDGVPLLPSPAPVKPEECQATEDVTAYIALGLHFIDKATAMSVVDFVNSLPQVEGYYLNGNWSGPRGVRPVEERCASVSESDFWSQAHYDQHRAQLEGYKVAKESYDKSRKTYDGILKQRSEVANRVRRVIQDAVDDRNDAVAVTTGFERYVVLADGDRDQALKFYLAATNYDEEHVRTVLNFPIEENITEQPTEAVEDSIAQPEGEPNNGIET